MAEDSSAGAVASDEKPVSRWFIPIVTAVVLVLVFCLYYFVYVGARREYLANRNFRMLAALGDQIQSLISIHGSILEFYTDLAAPGRHPRVRGRGKESLEKFLVPHSEDKELSSAEKRQEELKDYLTYLAPNFELTPPEEPSKRATTQTRLRVQRSGGRWVLVLGPVPEKEGTTDFEGLLNLDDLLKPLVGSLPFDDILLASGKGTIVYQDKAAGPRFTDLASLLENQTSPDVKKPASQTPELSMHSTEILLTGTRYKLFLQPVLIDVFTDDPTQPKTDPEKWVVCGLRASSALEWEALAISYTVIIWLTALLFAIFMSGPILKLFFMNQREHFRLREFALLGLFLVLLGSVFTLSGLQWAYFHWKNDDTERQLQQLGGNLSHNIYRELQLMRGQLVALCGTNELGNDLEQADKRHTEVIRKRPVDPPTDEKILTPLGKEYPYFANAFWTDDDGHQIVKWSTSEYVTPMIDVSKTPIYTHPKTTYLDGAGPPFYFDSILPPNKFEYLAALTMTTCACNRALCQPKNGGAEISGIVTGGSAFLVAQPFSLIDPVLPYGYGFALVDRKGAVLFHADKTRNRHENFEQESDWNKELYAATFGHATQRSMPINYRGRAYRALVVPVANVSQAPWLLIVYRDLTSVRTLNLQVITMTSTLLLLFLAGPTAITAIWCWIHRPRFVPEWAWPNPARVATYGYQIALYTLLIVLFLFLGFRASSEENVRACLAVPYTALVLTVWCFRSYSRPPGGGKPKRFLFAPTTFSGLAGIILVVVLFLQWAHLKELTLVMGVGGMAALPLLDRPREYLIRKFKLRYPGVQEAAPDSAPVKPGPLNYQTCYAVSVLLLLCLVGVLTPIALFRASLAVERRLRIKQAQLHLATTLDQKQRRIEDQRKTGERGNDTLSEFFRGSDWWRASGLVALFTPDGIPNRESYQTAGDGELYSDWFRGLIYTLHHDYNESAAEMLAVIPDRGSSKSGDSPDWAWHDEGKKICLRWHGAHPVTGDSDAQEYDLVIRSEVPGFSGGDTGIAVGIAAVVMLLMGGLFLLLKGKLFLFDISPLRITGRRQLAEYLGEGRNVLVLKPPVSKWQLEQPKWPLDIARMATGSKWAEELDLDTVPVNALIELKNFEYSTGDPEIDNQKRILLRRLIQREKTQVAAIMTVDASPEDYRRKFPELEVIDLREEPLLWLEACKGRARNQIWKECGPLPALWPIGVQLDRDMQTESIHSEETIASEILERADAYYRLVWDELLDEQKFVLTQLAEDGLLNPVNERAVRQLVRRGLITKDPRFHIMNESFRRFLRSAATPELKREWRRQSRQSGWGRAHGAFATTMIVTGVFLLTTQNQLWQSSAAYVTTALGALGTLVKLFNTVRGSAAEKVS